MMLFDLGARGESNEDRKFFHSSFISKLMLILGLIASLIVLFVPMHIVIPNASFSAFFMGLPWYAFIRILFGLFLLSIFPGYFICTVFLSKFDFDLIQKFCLILAFSFTVNVFLALLFFKFGYLTLNNILLGVWIVVVVVLLTKFVLSKKQKISSVSLFPQPFTKVEFLLLLSVFVIMVFSSFFIVLSSDVGDIALENDINRYLAGSVSTVNGQTPVYLTLYTLLQFFTHVAQYFTGLPLFASYVSLNFYVLLFPMSFYFFLKSLYPENRKTAIIGAVFISITGSFASLGIFNLFSDYLIGGQSAHLALNLLFNKVSLGAAGYQYYVMPLAYSLLFLSLGFAYRYCRGKRVSDLLLCGLFAVLPLFTHSIFEFTCFIMTLLVFLLLLPLKTALKNFSMICFSILLFFIPFEFVTGIYGYTLVNYSFHFTSVFGYTNPVNLFIFPLSVCIVLLLVLIVFSKKIFHLYSILYRKILGLVDNRLSRITLLGIAALVFSLSIYFFQTNWLDLTIYSESWYPWYVVLFIFGLPLYLSIVTLPYILKKDAKSFVFLSSWLFAVFLLASLSHFLPNFFDIVVWGRRWIAFAIYPLIGLSAIGLSTLPFYLPSKKSVSIKLREVLLKFNLNKIRPIATVLLIFALLFSFLSYTYKIEFYYLNTSAKVVSDAEFDAYDWIINNTPENAIFLSVTEGSSTRIESIGGRSCFGYSDSTLSWPLKVLFNSFLPETLLYSLKELQISYIFISPNDMSFLSNNLPDTYLPSLLSVLLKVYDKENVTLYQVPDYPLFEDSNYVLIRPTVDFQNLSDVQESLALLDNFDSSLDSWRIISGEWLLDNNCLYTSGRVNSSNRCQIVSNESFRNFIYEFSGKSLCQNQPRYIWGVFRYQNSDNYYFFYIGNTAFEVFERVNGVNSQIAGGNLGLTLDVEQWNTVKIEAIYNTIKLYVNGNLIREMQGTGREGTIGFEALAGFQTSYDDVKVTSLILPPDSSSALLNYQAAANMLISSGINFSIVSDSELFSLKQNCVYIFPYNYHVSESLLKNLQGFISNGSHILFFDPFFGSMDELNTEQNCVLSSIFQVKLGAASKYSIIRFAEKSINLSTKCTVENLMLDTQDYIRILAAYESDKQSTPYILQKQIGLGTLSLIHITALLDPTIMPVLRQDICNFSLQSLMKSLPEPVETKNDLTFSFPQNFFQFTISHDIFKMLSNENLHNQIYVYNHPIILNGSTKITSNYVLMSMDNLFVDLEFINSTHNFSLNNDLLSYLTLKGSVILSIETDYVTLPSPNYGGHLTTLEFNSSIKIHVNLIDAELHLKTDDADFDVSFTTGNCTIIIQNTKANNLKIALDQPVMMIDGNLQFTEWQGIFWYGDKAILRLSTSSSIRYVIQGSLSLQPLYSFGGIQIKVVEVNSIANEKVYPLNYH